MKIIIDPRSSYAYGSFYVYGFIELVGRSNIIYDLKPFIHLCNIGNDMRFIVQKDEAEKKFFIHTHDSYKISEQDYQWCDVYGSVNANFTHFPQDKYPKIISLAPSFGIRIESSIYKVMFCAIMDLIRLWPYEWNRVEWNKYTQKEECNHYMNIKHFFARRYKTWKNRLPIEAYDISKPSKDDYIFFLSTLWYSDKWNRNDETVNLRRALFIRACKSIGVLKYEWGLLGNRFSSNDKFIDVLAEHGEPFAIYIEKTKRSTLVFNTPAFHNCHGWKLGEYLALGKCIVSTQLSNDLPYPLQHGKNIHFVEDSEESIREAIEYILVHPEYRHKLEQGARAYWEKYGTPEASLKLLGIV